MAYGSADTIERKKTGAYGPTIIDPATGMPTSREIAPGVFGVGQAGAEAQSRAAGQMDYANYEANGSPYGPQSPTSPSGGNNNSARNAIMQLWAFYNQKPKNAVNTVPALRQLIQGIKAQQNPYEQVAMPSLAAAGNPLAAYMQQSGADPAAAQQMQQMLAAEAAQTRQADVALQQQMGQSWKANQQALINQARQQHQLGKQQQAAAQQQTNNQAMMSMLELAIKNGLDLSKLGIQF